MIKGEIKHSNINIASGKNYSLNKILTLIKREIPFKIQYLINRKKEQPNLKPSILVAKNYGWEPKISITKGIERTCAIYNKNII